MKFIVEELHHIDGTSWMTARRTRKSAFYIDDDHATEAINILRWCVEKFGTHGQHISVPDSRWCISTDLHSKYYFKNPEDLTVFLLRWS